MQDPEQTAAQPSPHDRPHPEPQLEPTGVAAADHALERLADAATAPLEEHVEIFDEVQRRLHEGLAELDEG